MVKDLNKMTPAEFLDYRRRVERAENILLHFEGLIADGKVRGKRLDKMRQIMEKCERVTADFKRSKQSLRRSKTLAGV